MTEDKLKEIATEVIASGEWPNDMDLDEEIAVLEEMVRQKRLTALDSYQREFAK